MSGNKEKAVGFLGGSFNPIHLGHLGIAELLMNEFDLGKVFFIPSALSWMKTGEKMACVEDRFEMVKLAIQEKENFIYSRVDIERGGNSYTVDTVKDLRKEVGGQSRLYCLMGADSLDGFLKWRTPELIMSSCSIVVAARPGHDVEKSIREIHEAIPKSSGSIKFVNSIGVEISSSDIRKRVSEGRPITNQVPKLVEKYIQERGLYGA